MEKLVANAAKMSVSDEKKKLGLQPLAAKLPKNPSNNMVLVDTNIRKLEITSNQPIFKYDIKIEYHYSTADGKIAIVEFSNSKKSGAQKELDKSRCQRVYLEAAKQWSQLNYGGQYFYNKQSALFTLEKLKFSNDLVLEFKNGMSRRPNFLKAVFHLKSVAETFQATSNDIDKSINSCPALANKTLLEAMNLIASGPALENPNVITLGNSVHYLLDSEKYEINNIFFSSGNSYSASGVMKSVKALEGGVKKAELYIVTELKETLFHPDGVSLVDSMSSYRSEFKPDLKVNSFAGSKLAKAHIGLEVFLNYGHHVGQGEDRPIHKILSFGLSATDCAFDFENGRTTVADYFRNKYGIRLAYPDLMTAVVKGKLGKMNLPVELLVLCDSQKVTNPQMVNKEQSDMIKLSAAPPHVRKSKTDVVSQAVGLTTANVYGLCTIGAPTKVQGVVLPKPKISFAGNQMAQLPNPNSRVPTDFTRAGFFHEAKSLQNWEICFMQNEEISQLAQQLVQEMQKCGMNVKLPTTTFITRGNLKAVFESAKANKRQLVFFVIKERYELHQQIKAMEQQYDLLTQEVKAETALKIFKQPQTRQNIVNKTNMKLGGLNYLIRSEFLTPNLMIVGFQTASQGGGGDGPVSIGFAANMMNHRQKFAGGYLFVKRQKDLFGPILKSTMETIFKSALDCKQSKPEEIIVYFNGISEGQYSTINEEYIVHISDAWSKIVPSGAPKITLIATSKTHNERLYLNDKGRLANLQPGTVVDHTIVNPVINEFYLASAVARQGTTKTTKYTLIYTNFEKQTMQRLESITNDLCYDHQIVFQPISLPVPLFIAGRYSERGAANLAVVGPVITDNEIDYPKTNQKLGYDAKELFKTRFNA